MLWRSVDRSAHVGLIDSVQRAIEWQTRRDVLQTGNGLLAGFKSKCRVIMSMLLCVGPNNLRASDY
jgi:hypothetical protein